MDNTELMFEALPDWSTNPVGVTARAAVIGQMKGSTPGKDGYTKGSFQPVFFPNYKAAAYQEDLPAVTGLSKDWWGKLSAVILCDAMYHLTHDLKKDLKHDQISSDVAADNAAFQAKAVTWYAHVLAKSYPPFADPYAATTDRAAALAEYMLHLQSDEFVLFELALIGEGKWSHGDWELFHHWVKLSLLGATDAQIGQVIRTLKSKQLPVPAAVDEGAWRRYLDWMRPAAISCDEIEEEARTGILRAEPIPSSMVGMYKEEAHSFEFTANDKPGNPYRK